MASAILDPIVLACPDEALGRDAFESFVRGLVQWRALPSPCVATYKLRSTLEILCEVNGFPVFDPVRKSLRAFGITHIEARDVVTIVQSLLTNVPDAEDAIGTRELPVDSVVVEPAAAVVGRSSALVRGFHRVLAVALVMRHVMDAGEDCQYVLTRDGGETSVCAEVTLSEGRGSDSDGVPRQLAGSVALCSSLQKLHARLDLAQAWCGTASDAGRAAVLALFIAKLASEAATSSETPWKIGVAFLSTARELGFLHELAKARKLIRACGETVLRLSLAATHALRVGAGPNEAQRTRRNGEGAGAWRRDIDHEYHLHYWEGSEGVEFAAVVLHRDLRIPE